MLCLVANIQVNVGYLTAGPPPSVPPPAVVSKDSKLYGHTTGQPVLSGTHSCNWGILLEQSLACHC